MTALEPRTLQTHPACEEAALDRLSGDWDEDGTVSVYLPRDVAERLLAERGWDVNGDGGWVSPNGRVYWHTDQALQVALVAENA